MKLEDYNGYKVGAAKRKFNLGRADFEPGTLITKLNETKSQKIDSSSSVSDVKKVAIMGMI